MRLKTNSTNKSGWQRRSKEETEKCANGETEFCDENDQESSFGVVETHTQRESDCSRVIITKCVSQRKALKVSPKRVNTTSPPNSSVFQHIMSHHRGGAGGNQHLHYDARTDQYPLEFSLIFHRFVSGI